MAVNIVFGKTDKRINSTKQTFSGNTKTISCTLREPCSMQNPIFRFMLDSGTDAGFYNYCSWGSYYYWIDDIIYLSNDIIEVHCHLDPLATYKSSIKNTHGFAVYSNADNKSVNIDDTRLQPEIGPLMLQHSYACSMFKNKDSQGNESGIDCDNAGCVLMTFTQTNSVDWVSNLSPHDESQSGAITKNGVHTALLSWGEFASCFADLNDFGSNIVPSTLPQTMGDACLEIIQAFARAIQTTSGSSLLDNVQRAIWVPLSKSDLVTKCGAKKRYGLMLGGALSNMEWYEIPSTLVLQFENWIELFDPNDPLYPGNNAAYKFLLNDRFSSLQVVTPGGYAEIGTNHLLYGGTKLYMISSLSVASGEWAVKISNKSDYRNCLASFAGTIGFNLKGTINAIPQASMQIAKTGAQFVGAAVGMGVGAIVGGITAGEGMYINGIKDQMKFQHYGSETRAISSGIQHMKPQTNFSSDFPSGDFGGGASGMFLTPTAGIMTIHYAFFVPYAIYNDANNHSMYIAFCDQYGYPCNKYISLSGYSGFVQMSGASVEPDASGNGNQMSEASKSTINSYLNSGIYIE